MRTSDAKRPLLPDLEPDPATEDTYSPGTTTPAREEVRVVLLTVAIGLLSGLLIVWFRIAIDWGRLLLLRSWFGPRELLIGLIHVVIVQHANP